MIENLGGEEAAKAVFDSFRDRVEKAGLGKLHVNAIVSLYDAPELFQSLKRVGVDSCGSYNWSRMVEKFPLNDYDEVERINADGYGAMTSQCGMPYNPNVTMGWDVSPRSVQSEIYENVGYPFTGVLYGSPAQFEKALRNARDFALSARSTASMITLNAWNEWTEGSYLEPDELHGMGYLEAIRNVFKP